MAGRTHRLPFLAAWPKSSLARLAKFVACPRGSVAKFVALARLRYVPDAERQQEWSLNEKSSEPRSNHPVQTGFLPNLRRAPDPQARLAQKQFSASATLLVQRLRWLLCIFGRTERGQISAARHRASAVPCTTSDPNMHRAVEWLIKTNSQASSSRATSTASDLSDEDRTEND